MKSHLSLITIVTVILAVFAPAEIRAQSGTTVALAAGAAAIGGPVLAQALTGSKVQVIVEVYKETYPLIPKGGANSNHSPDLDRTQPFHLEGSSALGRLLNVTNDPVENPTETTVGEVAEQLGQLVNPLKNAAIGPSTLAHKLEIATTNSAYNALYQDFKGVSSDLTNLAAQIELFVTNASDSLMHGPIPPDKLHEFGNQIRSIRLKALTISRDFSPTTVEFLNSHLNSIFLEQSTNLKQSKNESNAVSISAGTVRQASWEALRRLKNPSAFGMTNSIQAKSNVSNLFNLLSYPDLTKSLQCQSK